MSVSYPSEKTIPPRPHVATLGKTSREDQPLRSKPTRFERWCRAVLFGRLKLLGVGRIDLNDPEQAFRFGNDRDAELRVRITVRDFQLYRHAVFGGSLGIAESFMRGHWDCNDLLGMMRLMARNTELLTGMEQGVARLLKLVGRVGHRLARNTLAGSQRNITAHYDLSNEFFATILDPTMTYSAGIFEQPSTTLAEASLAKYERLCQLIELNQHDHLLEIGSGWGGFACYAAREYGCRVTTTTISRAQHDYALKQIELAGLSNRIELLQQDYRKLRGEYDKIVSIEMIEAVGHEFLGTFFSKCDELLRPGGSLALQVITIPDQRYENYRRSVDFIQRHIFPGGSLPSLGALLSAASARSSLHLSNLNEFGDHYARTLAHWRGNFDANLATIRELGMSERLLRAWQWYFCYCETGFREQMIGLKQIVFTKPRR